MGLLAVLRSRFKKAAIGLMITASHNPEEDNGVKMVDPAGEMLEASWEIIATNIANVKDSELTAALQQLVVEHNIDNSIDALVILGRDTRKSSQKLSEAAIAGIKAMEGKVNDFEVVTTPQLHYLVLCTNTKERYGKASVEGYYNKFCLAFKEVTGTPKNNDKYTSDVVVDAANGVGAKAVEEFKKILNDVLDIEICNSGEGKLNFQVKNELLEIIFCVHSKICF